MKSLNKRKRAIIIVLIVCVITSVVEFLIYIHNEKASSHNIKEKNIMSLMINDKISYIS